MRGLANSQPALDEVITESPSGNIYVYIPQGLRLAVNSVYSVMNNGNDEVLPQCLTIRLFSEIEIL